MPWPSAIDGTRTSNANSSPPIRPIKSSRRMIADTPLAKARRISSPARWPARSFAALKSSRSRSTSRSVRRVRSEEHTSELQSLMRISYAVFCLQKKTQEKCLQTHNQDPLMNLDGRNHDYTAQVTRSDT